MTKFGNYTADQSRDVQRWGGNRSLATHYFENVAAEAGSLFDANACVLSAVPLQEAWLLLPSRVLVVTTVLLEKCCGLFLTHRCVCTFCLYKQQNPTLKNLLPKSSQREGGVIT